MKAAWKNTTVAVMLGLKVTQEVRQSVEGP